MEFDFNNFLEIQSLYEKFQTKHPSIPRNTFVRTCGGIFSNLKQGKTLSYQVPSDMSPDMISFWNSKRGTIQHFKLKSNASSSQCPASISCEMEEIHLPEPNDPHHEDESLREDYHTIPIDSGHIEVIHKMASTIIRAAGICPIDPIIGKRI